GDLRLHAGAVVESDAADRLLHQSTAGDAVWRVDADRGHAEVGAAADLPQSDRAFRDDCAERAHQGRRARHRLSESARAARPRECFRGHQRVAVSKAAELSARSAGRFALANATEPAAASAASTAKPGT